MVDLRIVTYGIKNAYLRFFKIVPGLLIASAILATKHTHKNTRKNEY